jgi:DNA topoisomerase-1
VKRLEELGIGRPSTYASILQTLKDREYVRVEKGRFVPEESGRLVTAFLERFFERYVSYDYTAELEEELDDVSGGRLDWQKVLDDFWRDFRPKAGEVMDQKPSEITQAIDEFLEPWLYPPRSDGSDPRLCPQCGEGRLSLRGGRFGAFVACSNYPECRYTQKFGQGGEQAQSEGPQELGDGILLKTGRFGPYVERGDKRASIPKDVPVDDLTSEFAEKLLSLPREIGPHPETGKVITASIGRYGPYLAHDGKYAKLGSTTEVFETGMNAAVAKLADAASVAGRQRGASREPIAALGKHPASGDEVRVMAGRYGPYVTDGITNATLPRNADPKVVSLDEAVRLIDDRAAKGVPKQKGARTSRRKQSK